MKRLKAIFTDHPDAVLLAAIVVLGLVWGRFFWTGVPFAGTTDIEMAFIKAAAFVQSWKDGFFLGRWSLDLNYGYGYPLFNFYAPLFFYCAGALALVTGSIAWGMHMALLLIGILSAVAMYFFARRWWGREAAFVAAVAFLFAPYHSWDVYNRGTCAEFTAFLFLPLLFLSIDGIFERPGIRAFISLALAQAGLILSHNIMAMLVSPLAFVYIALRTALDPERRWFKGFSAWGAQAYGVALAAYFWLPALVEKGAVQINRVTAGWVHFSGHFMSLKNALFSAWANYQEPFPLRLNGVFLAVDPKAFQLGGVLVIGAVLAVLACPLVFRRSRLQGVLLLFWAMASATFVFLMTPAGSGVWIAVKPLAFVQLPWRFFVILSFTLSFLGASLIFLLPDNKRLAAAALAAALVVFLYLPFARPFGGGYKDNLTELKGLKDLKSWVYAHHPQDAMEYLPVDVRIVSPMPPAVLLNVVKGEARLDGVPVKPAARYRCRVSTQTGAVLMLSHYYFPGWTVLVDGKRTKALSDNPFGVVLFIVPPGEHQVDIFFGHTPVRWAGEGISLLAIAGLIALWVVSRGRGKKALWT